MTYGAALSALVAGVLLAFALRGRRDHDDLRARERTALDRLGERLA